MCLTWDFVISRFAFHAYPALRGFGRIHFLPLFHSFFDRLSTAGESGSDRKNFIKNFLNSQYAKSYWNLNIFVKEIHIASVSKDFIYLKHILIQVSFFIMIEPRFLCIKIIISEEIWDLMYFTVISQNYKFDIMEEKI